MRFGFFNQGVVQGVDLRFRVEGIGSQEKLRRLGRLKMFSTIGGYGFPKKNAFRRPLKAPCAFFGRCGTGNSARPRVSWTSPVIGILFTKSAGLFPLHQKTCDSYQVSPSCGR